MTDYFVNDPFHRTSSRRPLLALALCLLVFFWSSGSGGIGYGYLLLEAMEPVEEVGDLAGESVLMGETRRHEGVGVDDVQGSETLANIKRLTWSVTSGRS